SPSVTEVKQHVTAHLHALHKLYGEDAGVRIARKHMGWYTQAFPEGIHFRKQFNTLTNARAQHEALEHYFFTLSRTTDHIDIGGYRMVHAADSTSNTRSKRGLTA